MRKLYALLALLAVAWGCSTVPPRVDQDIDVGVESAELPDATAPTARPANRPVFASSGPPLPGVGASGTGIISGGPSTGYVTSVAPTIPGGASPSGVFAGASGWWSADNLNATVASWPDQSGNGHTATAAGGAQPTLNTSALNGLPCFHFGGSAVFTVSGLTVTEPYTIWAVARSTGSEATGALASFQGANVFLRNSSTDNVSQFSFGPGFVRSGIAATSYSSILGYSTTYGGSVGFHVGGVGVAPISPSAGAVYTPGSAIGSDNPSAGNNMTGDICEIAVWPSVLSGLQLAQLDGYATSKYALPAVPANLVVSGDSFTVGGGGVSQPWLGQLVLNQLGTGWGSTYINNGVSGKTLEQILVIDQASTFLQSTLEAPLNVHMMQGGTNSFYFGDTVAQAETAIIAECTGSRAAGYLSLVPTILSRGDAGTPGNFDANRDAYNVWLRGHYAEWCDGLVDWAADTRMGADGAWSNTTYFQDDVHPTQIGYEIGAGLWAGAIRGLLRHEYGGAPFASVDAGAGGGTLTPGGDLYGDASAQFVQGLSGSDAGYVFEKVGTEILAPRGQNIIATDAGAVLRTDTGPLTHLNGEGETVLDVNGTPVLECSPTAVLLDVTTLGWSAGETPQLAQLSTSGTTGTALQIQPQQSTNGTSETGGPVNVNLQTPLGAGTHASLNVQENSVNAVKIGAGISPLGSRPAVVMNGDVLSAGAGCEVNCSDGNSFFTASNGDLFFEDTTHWRASGTQYCAMSSSGLVPTADDAISLGTASFRWDGVYVGPDVLDTTGFGGNSTAGTTPSFKTASPITFTGTVTLTAAQYANYILPLTGTLGGNANLVFPGSVGSSWDVGFANVTWGGHTVVLCIGSAGTCTGSHGCTGLTNSSFANPGFSVIHAEVTTGGSSGVLECH